MEPKIMKSDYKGFPQYYSSDLDQVLGLGLHEALKKTCDEAVSLLQSESILALNRTYPPSLWIIRQMLEHSAETELEILHIVIDASNISKEKLKSKNILARLDEIKENPVLEHNVSAFLNVRNITIDLFHLFDEEELNSSATYFGNNGTVLLGGFLIAAHILGQLQVIKNLYLKEKSNA